MAKKQFLGAWAEASKARDHLEQVHQNKFHIVEQCIINIETNSGRNKRIQTQASALGVTVTGLAFFTQGFSLLAVPILSASKWASKTICNWSIEEEYEEAVTIFAEDHQARKEFIVALRRVWDARCFLVEQCPELNNLNYSGICMALMNYPGVKVEIGTIALYEAGQIMILNNPETTLELLITTVNLTVSFIAHTVGPDAAIAALDIALLNTELISEMIPVVGTVINLIKFQRAKRAQSKPSPEAAELRKQYKASQQHYEELLPYMEQFQKDLKHMGKDKNM